MGIAIGAGFYECVIIAFVLMFLCIHFLPVVEVYLLENARKLLSEFEVKILGYYLDGLTCREIAETVGRSPKSVDNAVQRLRRKIARQLLSGDISKG